MNRQTTNIVITGFSGTGKSLVAREIARQLGWDFIDTDAEIVTLAKKPIAEIFSGDGEGKFRELEREVIKRASRQSHRVIATGGGAIVIPRVLVSTVDAKKNACPTSTHRSSAGTSRRARGQPTT